MISQNTELRHGGEVESEIEGSASEASRIIDSKDHDDWSCPNIVNQQQLEDAKANVSDGESPRQTQQQ